MSNNPPPTQRTPLELKTIIAKGLRGLICKLDHTNLFHWLNGQGVVTEAEWLYLCQQFLKDAGPRFRVVYIGELYCVVDTEGSAPSAQIDDLKIATASWEQHATAIANAVDRTLPPNMLAG